GSGGGGGGGGVGWQRGRPGRGGSARRRSTKSGPAGPATASLGKQAGIPARQTGCWHAGYANGQAGRDLNAGIALGGRTGVVGGPGVRRWHLSAHQAGAAELFRYRAA